MSGEKPVLAYWDIRGLAEPIRLLLAYCKQDYEDKHYVCGPAPDFNRDCWLNEKFTLGIPFPNLPYFIDGDIKIVQSNAILRYIGRKNDLCGKTEEEKVKVDIMENQAMDFRNGFVGLCYRPTDSFEKAKAKYLENVLPNSLKAFSEFLGDNDFFAGRNITMVDFPMYELLDQHRVMEPKCLDKYDNIKKFMDRFEAIPEIVAFWKSPSYKKLDINNRMAHFRG